MDAEERLYCFAWGPRGWQAWGGIDAERGIDGVATFDAHPSAVRDMPERITYLCKHTVLAATVAGEETYEGELALAMRVASAGFEKARSDVIAARKATETLETYALTRLVETLRTR